PGVFSVPPDPPTVANPPYQVGPAAAIHSNGSLVSVQSPARIGETISVFLTGLGRVTPAVADGAPGVSAEPLNTRTIPPTVYVNGITARVTYAGLAPQLIGLYQVNFRIPNGVAPGNVTLGIGAPLTLNSQAILPIGP